ncbi:MAG: hypothetical protein R3B57_04705 [Phycisphaerales bacterium]
MRRMPPRLALTLAAALGVLVAPTIQANALAQPADQVENAHARALEILARHVEAIGGEKAIRSHTDITTTGRLIVPSAGLEGTITTHAKAPDKILTNVDLPGYGVSMTGYDGKTAWMVDPGVGALIMEDEQRDAFVRSSRLDAELRIEKDYPTIKYVGEDKIDDQPVDAILLVDKNGRESTHYFSKETGLRVAISTLEPTQFGDMPVRYVFSDYKDFDGLKQATKTDQHIGPQTITITIDSVTFDPIPDETLAPPETIQVLVKQQADGSDDEADDNSNGADDDDGDADDDDGDDGDDDDDDD